MKLVIFTDLDGTLLDPSFSFHQALPALETIRIKEIPCVICSSKTRLEIEHYREKFSNQDVFVPENGGAICIPGGYFRNMVVPAGCDLSTTEKYTVLGLGRRYEELRQEIRRLRRRGFAIRGFGDMTEQDVAQLTGLSHEEAKLAKQREYDEPFVFEGTEKEFQCLIGLVRKDGFSYVEGSIFSHLLGQSDKGKAVSIAADLYRREFGKITTVALGDGPNDVPMLQAVDSPVVLPSRHGSVDPRMKGFGFIEADRPGPAGWNETVLRFIAKFTI